METGATLLINTDAHAPGDLITLYRAKVVLRGAGIAEETVDQILANSQKLIDSLHR
jgi:histidinol phosphatase-like PHP family hydrolase